MSRAATTSQAPQVQLVKQLARVLQGWDEVARVMAQRVNDRFADHVTFDIVIPAVGYVDELTTKLALTHYEATLILDTSSSEVAEAVRSSPEYIDALNTVNNCNTAIARARAVFEDCVRGEDR